MLLAILLPLVAYFIVKNKNDPALVFLYSVHTDHAGGDIELTCAGCSVVSGRAGKRGDSRRISPNRLSVTP